MHHRTDVGLSAAMTDVGLLPSADAWGCPLSVASECGYDGCGNVACR
jgi:hypothetical protein